MEERSLSHDKRRWAAAAEMVSKRVNQSPQEVAEPLAELMRDVQGALSRHPDDLELQRIETNIRLTEASLYTQQGRFSLAEQRLRALQQEHAARGEPQGTAKCLHALSVLKGRQGDEEASLAFLEQCFHLQRQSGAPPEQRARTVMNIGITQAILKEHHTALETLQFAAELYGDLDEEARGIIETNQALVYRSLDQHDQSRRLLDSAVARLASHSLSVHLLNARLEQVNHDIEHGDLSTAQATLQALPAMMDQIGMPYFQPEYLLVAARLWLAQGCPDEAEAELAKALPLCTMGQRGPVLALRVAAAEAAGEWRSALKWQRIAHTEQMAQTESYYKARLAAARTQLVDRLETEQRDWLRAELQQAHTDARDLATQLSNQKTMLATTAHDINNPLSVVLLLGELASTTPDALHDSAEAIVEAARHMRGLVTHLLESARQPRTEPALQLGTVPLQALLESVHVRYTSMAAEKQQRFTVEHAVRGCAVQGDRRAMERVLDNLVSNAIKYTPREGTIQLRAQQQGEHVTLEVLDTGPGLSPADLQRVFLYPQRLSAVPTNGEAQHGLGLVSVRRLVTAMGGRVHAENRLRKGARFVVHLLADRSAPSAQS